MRVAGAGRKKTSASAIAAARVSFTSARRARAFLLVFVCLLALLTVAPASYTQDHMRPRKASGQQGASGSNASDSTSDSTQSQSGQKSKQGAEAVDDDEVVRINASEVLVPVTVRDPSGQLVADLKRKDFRVFEDGREQP